MRHVILTCSNHPELRWSCKEIAITNCRYNGERSLFFLGIPSGKGMYSDNSGLDCINVTTEGKLIPECNCHVHDLIIAPEDALVKRYSTGEPRNESNR